MTSPTGASVRTVTAGVVMHDSAVCPVGFFPSATTRHTMSRSVTTPTGRLLESVTGISPQLFCCISLATWSNVVFGEQQAGSGVMMSRASLAIFPPAGRVVARDSLQPKNQMVPGKRLATGIAGCVMKVIFLAALGLTLGL